MKSILLSPLGTDLASRRSAAQLRSNIDAILATGDKVIIDLSHISSLSDSYADELFGILALERGLSVFSILIAIRGATDSVIRRVAAAIKSRVAKQEIENTLHTLVAAKHASNRSILRRG